MVAAAKIQPGRWGLASRSGNEARGRPGAQQNRANARYLTMKMPSELHGGGRNGGAVSQFPSPGRCEGSTSVVIPLRTRGSVPKIHTRVLATEQSDHRHQTWPPPPPGPPRRCCEWLATRIRLMPDHFHSEKSHKWLLASLLCRCMGYHSGL